MKKLLLTVIVLSLSCSPVLAEQNISVKVGWINQLCKNIKDSPVIAVAYEICNKWLGVEMETSVFTTDIPQVERLYVSSISLIPKIYI